MNALVRLQSQKKVYARGVQPELPARVEDTPYELENAAQRLIELQLLRQGLRQLVVHWRGRSPRNRLRSVDETLKHVVENLEQLMRNASTKSHEEMHDRMECVVAKPRKKKKGVYVKANF